MVKQYIKVPKGTIVYEADTSQWDIHPQTDKNGPSTRDMVVEFYGYASPNHEQRLAQMPKIVMWSKGKKYCLDSDVQHNVEPPVRKEPETRKPPKVTLRQRMVKGSKWKLTEPATVIKPSNPVTKHGHSGHTWQEYFPVPDYNLPVGTEIEVTGKTSTGVRFDHPQFCWFSGVWVPIKVAGSKDIVWVEFKELNKNPEQVGEAVVEYLFYIRDKKTKQYYVDYSWPNYGFGGSKLTYTDKLTKAKKFKRLADVRVHALIQSGYYDDLPESWGSIPEWMCGRKVFDIPKTWEIVKVNKATKEEIEAIELLDTFNRSWKLRALTVKFSSAVRAVYSDLEKKGKLGEYSAMMMFKHKTDTDDRWADELTDEEKDEVNALLARFAGDAKICKTSTGFAVAVKDAMTTTMIRLAYAGTLDCVMIDFETMEEVVSTK